MLLWQGLYPLNTHGGLLWGEGRAHICSYCLQMLIKNLEAESSEGKPQFGGLYAGIYFFSIFFSLDMF